jgi:cyclophilin family peptidyl-prolyl cis-trans isomerase
MLSASAIEPLSAAALSGSAAAVSQAVESGPTLSPVSDQTTAIGAPITFTLQATDPSGDGVVFKVVDGFTFGPPLHLTINIDQMTKQVTLTPEAGFQGSIALRAGVRSATSADAEENYDFEPFMLNVVGASVSPIVDPTTSVGTATTVTLSSSDPVGHGVVYQIVDPTTHQPPANVSISINQATGEATLTPAPGFSGDIPLLARVRSVDSPDVDSSYGTESFMLHVESNLTLDQPDDVSLPGTKSVLVPLTGIDSAGQPITYTFSSSDPDVQLALVSPQSKSLVLNVSGTDKDGNPFTGQLVLHLFEDLAPGTTARIEQLVEQGFFSSKTFHRVIDGFMAQAGASSGTTLTDELQSGLAFVSRGLLAMANAGSDTADAEFFITATNEKESSDPITLAHMPQHLNNRYTIFGQLVKGFDVFEKLITTDVVANPNDSTELSKPVNTITITSASLIDDAQDAVLRVTASSGFTGNATISVTAHGSSGSTTTKTFTATGVADTKLATDPPFLGAVANQTTTVGVPISFALNATNPSGAPLTYSVVDASGSTPANVTVNINQATGQVTLTPAAGFTGVIHLKAGVKRTADTNPNAVDTQAFDLTVNAASETKPTLNAVANQTTTAGTAVMFTLTSTNPGGGDVVYKVADPTTFGTPANVTVVIDQNTGKVTLTPAAGFTGTINLVAGVRSADDPDVQASYDLKSFTLTVGSATPAVPTGLAIVSSSTSGPFDGNGYVSNSTPILTLNAATGSTVQIKRNGTVIGNATETASGSGVFRFTLPAGALAVGANSITAAASNTAGASADSTAFSIIYAPDYSTGVYVVPGQPGTTQSLSMTWATKNASYDNEFGFAIVDSIDGTIGGVAPGQAGYAQALLGSSTRQVIFARGQGAGATTNVSLPAGRAVVFYLIQNNTTGGFQAKNLSNTPHGNNNKSAPLAFFSVQAANPDGQRHTQIIADSMTGFVQLNWEDMFSLGDGDFNDAAIVVRNAGQAAQSPAGLRAPGANRNVTLNATLVPGSKFSPSGDFGVFFVDEPSGKIGNLNPGDSGYAAAALASSNIAVLFGAGASGSKQVTVPGGKYLAFYAITSGTTANFLSSNPTNGAGSTNALFSYDIANPDDANHFRWVSPGQQMANASLAQLHVMDKLGGGDGDFDAYSVNLSFTA